MFNGVRVLGDTRPFVPGFILGVEPKLYTPKVLDGYLSSAILNLKSD
jgi:hypothetical protein